MTLRTYTLVAALVFAGIAVLQMMRILLEWPITVDLGWGVFSLPFWTNWVASIAFAFLAWLGIVVSRGANTSW